MTTVAGSHDAALVALSIVVATVASYTALDLAGRIQAATGWTRHVWLAAAAVAMGGGIWSMHFVAMLAFSMPGMEVHYNVGLTLISLGLPILVTGAGFFVISGKAHGSCRSRAERALHGPGNRRYALHRHGGHGDGGRPQLRPPLGRHFGPDRDWG